MKDQIKFEQEMQTSIEAYFPKGFRKSTLETFWNSHNTSLLNEDTNNLNKKSQVEKLEKTRDSKSSIIINPYILQINY